MHEATWCVSQDEERIWVGQEVVDRVAIRQHAHGTDCVYIVVCSANTQVGNHQTLCNELQLTWDDQLGAAQCDLETTLVNEASDVDQRVLERGFVEVSRSGWFVGESAATCQRVVSCAKLLAVAASEGGVEGVVEDMGANACDFMPNANVYKIRATKRIFAGKEVEFEDYYYPPMNGSRSLMGEINCVDKIK